MKLTSNPPDRRTFLGQAALTSLAWANSSAWCSQVVASESAFAGGHFGINIAGAEFGTELDQFCNESPGRCGYDYTYGEKSTVAFFCNQRLPLIRIPFRWERIQPRLGGPLNLEELSRLGRRVSWVHQSGGQVVLDVHNYARFFLRVDGVIRECVIDETAAGTGPPAVSRSDLGDLWQRLAEVFRDNPTVVGYGLMNEPHDLPSGRWKDISNYVVQRIRNVDRRTSVIVAGDGWSNSANFARINGEQAWVNDPADNVVYEAHCYFDHDFSGTYRWSFDKELHHDPQAAHRGRTRLVPFLDWCTRNGVRGFIGEFGVPSSENWLSVLGEFAAILRHRGVAACYWAAGEFWGNYPLSIQPYGGHKQPQHAALLKLL
ncbi:MAG: glycoside hydrolase family 5 protein [Pirellulaceae bacterium]